MTHLACADEDKDATARQLDRFDEAVAALQQRGITPRYVHACNSAGLAFFRPTHTLVRPGLLLYGLRPKPLSPEVDVRPVMTVSADIALVKEIPAGTPVSYGGRWVAPRPSRIGTHPDRLRGRRAAHDAACATRGSSSCAAAACPSAARCAWT